MSQGLVLVVDDEENIRKILSAMLEAEGHHVLAAAKIAYRRRIEELRVEREAAELVGDEDRAWELQRELDALAAELARALGLGGRHRRAGSAAERARVNVTRAIRTAINRIEEVLPELGRHLDRSVRTGFFCRYEPAADDAVQWSVHRTMNTPRPD